MTYHGITKFYNEISVFPMLASCSRYLSLFIVGQLFETSMKWLFFVRSQWNFVCIFFKAFWIPLNRFWGKLYIFSKTILFFLLWGMGYLEWSNEIRTVSISGEKLAEVMFIDRNLVECWNWSKRPKLWHFLSKVWNYPLDGAKMVILIHWN